MFTVLIIKIYINFIECERLKTFKQKLKLKI